MPPADVVAVAGEETRRAAIADREHPEAVVLYLEQPAIAIKRLAAALDDLEREFIGPKHGNHFSRKSALTQSVYRAINATEPYGALAEWQNPMKRRARQRCKRKQTRGTATSRES